MKSKISILSFLAVSGVLLCSYWLAGTDTPTSSNTDAATVSSPTSSGTAAPSMTMTSAVPVSSVATPAKPTTLPPLSNDPQVILETIQAASISYDPVELPRIQPYLSHPDPEIRKAALNGIIVLGDAAGAPLLREAASRSPTREEATLLREKADYLELPSAYDLMKAGILTKRKAGLPTPDAP